MKSIDQKKTFPYKFISNSRKSNFFIWLLSPISIGVLFLLLSFSAPRYVSYSSVLPFLKSTSNEPPNINCKIDHVTLDGYYVNETILMKMEQTEGIYSKVLNMSVVDKDENILALTLMDVQIGNIGSCMNTIQYYGKEHIEENKNHSIDLRLSNFSNSCSLIFEKKDDSSIISRNGWVKISSCENNMISGFFQFEIEEGDSKKLLEGDFENVLIQIEE